MVKGKQAKVFCETRDKASRARKVSALIRAAQLVEDDWCEFTDNDGETYGTVSTKDIERLRTALAALEGE